MANISSQKAFFKCQNEDAIKITIKINNCSKKLQLNEARTQLFLFIKPTYLKV